MTLRKMVGARKALGVGVALVLAGTMALSGCTSGGGPQAAPTQVITDVTNHPDTTISVWVFNKLPTEVDAIQASINRLQDKYSWLHVNLVTAKDDTAFAQAVTANNPPDVFVTASPDNVAKFCYDGTVADMNPLIKSAGLDVNATFPAAALTYTQYQGKQCALPLLVDAYGLYYNKKMFSDAGITDLPKTLSELTADVQKLTKRDGSGKITQWGMSPPRVDYGQFDNIFVGGNVGAPFYDDSGKSTLGSDPAWVDMLNWQKGILDYFGADQTQKFVATYSAHTDDAKNPFVNGQSAIEFDGEWHIGELAANAPKLDYGVMPMPVPDSQAAKYGAGNVVGTVVYIPSGSTKQDAAFLAVQQLTTDTDFLTTFATAMSNVPTTFDSLNAWQMGSDEKWKTFIDITKNENSFYKSLTPAGAEDVTTFTKFIENWQQGKVSDLPSGLTQLAQQIDELNAQASS